MNNSMVSRAKKREKSFAYAQKAKPSKLGVLTATTERKLLVPSEQGERKVSSILQ